MAKKTMDSQIISKSGFLVASFTNREMRDIALKYIRVMLPYNKYYANDVEQPCIRRKVEVCKNKKKKGSRK